MQRPTTFSPAARDSSTRSRRRTGCSHRGSRAARSSSVATCSRRSSTGRTARRSSSSGTAPVRSSWSRSSGAGSSGSSSARTAAAASTCGIPGSGSRHFEDPDSFVKMNGREVFKFATRVMVSSANEILAECGKTVDDIDVYVPHQANKRIIDYAAAKLGIPSEKTIVNVDRFGNTSSGSIPLALADARAEGRLQDGDAGSADRDGRRAHVGLGAHRMDEREALMTKVAFCFPGQGSLEEGMGREIAEAFPAAREVYRIGSEATGLDLEELCFATPLERARRDRGAAARTGGDQPGDPRGDARARARAGRRRRPLGRRVRGSRRGGLARDGHGHRARARARSRDGGGSATAARRDGGDPRARGRGGREAVPADRRRVAGELQLPGSDRRLGRARGGRGVLRRGREPRRPTSRDPQGLGRVPQPARRAGCGPASPRARSRQVRRAALALHVDGHREDRARAEGRRRCSSIS